MGQQDLFRDAVTLEFDVKKGQGGAHFVYGVRFPDGFHVESADLVNTLVKKGISGFKSSMVYNKNVFKMLIEPDDILKAA